MFIELTLFIQIQMCSKPSDSLHSNNTVYDNDSLKMIAMTFFINAVSHFITPLFFLYRIFTTEFIFKLICVLIYMTINELDVDLHFEWMS